MVINFLAGMAIGMMASWFIDGFCKGAIKAWADWKEDDKRRRADRAEWLAYMERRICEMQKRIGILEGCVERFCGYPLLAIGDELPDGAKGYRCYGCLSRVEKGKNHVCHQVYYSKAEIDHMTETLFDLIKKPRQAKRGKSKRSR